MDTASSSASRNSSIKSDQARLVLASRKPTRLGAPAAAIALPPTCPRSLSAPDAVQCTVCAIAWPATADAARPSPAACTNSRRFMGFPYVFAGEGQPLLPRIDGHSKTLSPEQGSIPDQHTTRRDTCTLQYRVPTRPTRVETDGLATMIVVRQSFKVKLPRCKNPSVCLRTSLVLHARVRVSDQHRFRLDSVTFPPQQSKS